MTAGANRLSARDAARRLAARELTCEALVRDCLARVAEREPVVRAWAHHAADAVLARARQIDAGPVLGPLHGLPVGVKDVIDTADEPTQYNSSLYTGHRPAADAACVGMVKAAGAIVLGKTVTTEFATSFPGPTTNPHNAAHTPGGSSSGSAAGVADFMMPFAFGTQTGGSVIRPASYCGVVGSKPSFGLINRTGVRPVSDSLDTVGVMARSVDDAAFLAAAAAGRADLAGVTPTKPGRVALWRGPEWDEARPEAVAAVDRAARALSSAGVTVVELKPAGFEGLLPAHHEIEYFEIARAFAHEYATGRNGLSAALVSRIEHGLACPPELYVSSLADVVRCRALFADLMRGYDVVLTASSTGEAPAGLSSTGSAVFNRGWTMLHAPCVTLPGAVGPLGLPVGVQVTGPYLADRKVLGVAGWLHGLLDTVN